MTDNLTARLAKLLDELDDMLQVDSLRAEENQPRQAPVAGSAA